ncbi:MAG: hypothetical protein E7214_14085 [Clostridium sp.]|nr:hypothetical protein [Clostridium sp.]
MLDIVKKEDVDWAFPYYAPFKKEAAKYIYQVNYDYKAEQGTNVHNYLVKLGEANNAENKDNRYLCYASWIGTGIVWRIHPAEEDFNPDIVLDDKDILKKHFGEEGEKLYKDFRDSLTMEDKKLLKLVPDFSNLENVEVKEDKPFEVIYYVKISLMKSYKEIESAVKKVVKSANQNHKNLKWVVYKEMADDNTLYLYVASRNFAGLDYIKDIKEILLPEYSDECATSIKEEIYSNIKEYETTLITFTPSCDNSGCKFNE